MTQYPAHNLADVLRETLRRVEQGHDPNDPDPDLLELKRILKEKIARVEEEKKRGY